MASASIFFSLSAACSVQGSFSAHVWSIALMSGGGSTHIALLNRVEFKAIRLINSPPLTDCLDSLSHRRNVAPYLSSTAIFMLTALHKLLTACTPPIPRSHCNRLSTASHPYSVYLPNARVNQYLNSFIHYTGKLCNSLPLSVFPPVYDLNSFKREVSRHLSY